jgi:hypothetical protein
MREKARAGTVVCLPAPHAPDPVALGQRMLTMGTQVRPSTVPSCIVPPPSLHVSSLHRPFMYRPSTVPSCIVPPPSLHVSSLVHIHPRPTRLNPRARLARNERVRYTVKEECVS